jgi:hypothetical protein
MRQHIYFAETCRNHYDITVVSPRNYFLVGLAAAVTLQQQLAEALAAAAAAPQQICLLSYRYSHHHSSLSSRLNPAACFAAENGLITLVCWHFVVTVFVLLQYTPLLPAVAVGTMEEGSIVEPVRKILAGKVCIVNMCRPCTMENGLRVTFPLKQHRSLAESSAADTDVQARVGRQRQAERTMTLAHLDSSVWCVVEQHSSSFS